MTLGPARFKFWTAEAEPVGISLVDRVDYESDMPSSRFRTRFLVPLVPVDGSPSPTRVITEVILGVECAGASVSNWCITAGRGAQALALACRLLRDPNFGHRGPTPQPASPRTQAHPRSCPCTNCCRQTTCVPFGLLPPPSSPKGSSAGVNGRTVPSNSAGKAQACWGGGMDGGWG
jgi:hypothetical protein